jgi:hypothetical protein
LVRPRLEARPPFMPAVARRIRFSRSAVNRRGWRICGWLSVALYLAVAIGFSFPLPQPTLATVQKDRSQPFPCMDSPCGCRSAEQCWRHCCCHSLAERLAWARQNQVQPPDDVLAEANAEGIDWQSPAEHDCCAGDEAASEGGTAPGVKAICCACTHPHMDSGDGDACQQPRPVEPGHRSVAASRGVVLLKMLECQGIGGNWLAAILSLPPPAALRWEMSWNRLGSVASAARLVSSLAADPATPPPRAHAA